MGRQSPLIWVFLFLILVLPTAAGRFLLDLAGGLILVFFTFALIIAGIGWLGWRKLNANMTSCENCGAKSISNSSQCLVCGSPLKQNMNSKNNDQKFNLNEEAKNITIDVTPENDKK